jgi:hypothetical protein
MFGCRENNGRRTKNQDEVRFFIILYFPKISLILFVFVFVFVVEDYGYHFAFHM